MTNLLVVLLLFGVAADATTEKTGVVLTYRATSETSGVHGSVSSLMVTEVKILGTQIRMDSYMGGIKGTSSDTTTIYDSESGILTYLDPMKKTYQRQTKEEQELIKKLILDTTKKHGQFPTERPVLEKTGRTAEIDGQKVEEYKTEALQMKLTYWFAQSDQLKELNTHMMSISTMPLASLGHLWFPDPASYPGFPLKTIIETEQQGMKMHQVVEVEVEFGVEMDPAQFEIPEGYRPMPGHSKN